VPPDIRKPEIHAAIISWDGYGNAARQIAGQVAPSVTSLRVVYSNSAGAKETGPGDWIDVPNSAFFGAKFRRAIETHNGGIFLLLHADTAFSDWPALVERCQDVFDRHADLAIWSPDFTHTSFPNSRVKLADGPEPGLISVGFPDGIVLALRDDVVRWLKDLDYSENNLGWGIVWAAVAYATTRGLLVCRDANLIVGHEVGRGYDTTNARRQGERFLSQLSADEQRQIDSLRELVKKPEKPLGFWARLAKVALTPRA
jgi:O-antigen biosynthesis protein